MHLTHSRHSPINTELEQIYGGFDFGRGVYKGVFRFSSQQEEQMGNPCKDDIEECLLPNEIPSAKILPYVTTREDESGGRGGERT